jgi:hypothetical protein
LYICKQCSFKQANLLCLGGFILNDMALAAGAKDKKYLALF